MPISTPRHRRKAGSGPPAAALIAWIGADARLCSAAAATAGYRYETDLRPPAIARPARAAAASFALVCGAVLTATANTSEGFLGPRHDILPPTAPQDLNTRPDQQAPPILPKQVQPIPEASPVRAPVAGGTGGTSVVRQSPQFIPVPPAAEPAGQAAGRTAPVVPARPESGRREPVRTESARREPVRPEAARPGGTIHPGRSGPQRATGQPPDAVRSGGTVDSGVTARSPSRTSSSTRESAASPHSGRGPRSGLGTTLNRGARSLGSPLHLGGR